MDIEKLADACVTIEKLTGYNALRVTEEIDYHDEEIFTDESYEELQNKISEKLKGGS